jgi:hypothetical protein
LDVCHALDAAFAMLALEPPPGRVEDRILVIGPARDGTPLEVVAVVRSAGGLLVIHAMHLRKKYRHLYEGSA